MREIKFRAWDSELREWCDADTRGWNSMFDLSQDSYKDGKKVLIFENSNYPEIIINQYTGLLDKNGVEIYEGDIIKNSLNDILEVVWNEDRCCFEMRGRYENSHIQRQLDCDIIIDLNITIVGNIYEHPHLLGEKNEK